MNTRQTILAAVGILVIVVVGAWWYLGFTLDFMRFFAAEPGTTDRVVTRQSPPPGCYYQNVQCIQAPCDPILVCPTCVPRPSCMNDDPPCMPDLAPGAILCPPPPSEIGECSPKTQTVTVGQQAVLTATYNSGPAVWTAYNDTEWFHTWDGAIDAHNSRFAITYSQPGVKKVLVMTFRQSRTEADPSIYPVLDTTACTVVVEPTQPQ